MQRNRILYHVPPKQSILGSLVIVIIVADEHSSLSHLPFTFGPWTLARRLRCKAKIGRRSSQRSHFPEGDWNGSCRWSLVNLHCKAKRHGLSRRLEPRVIVTSSRMRLSLSNSVFMAAPARRSRAVVKRANGDRAGAAISSAARSQSPSGDLIGPGRKIRFRLAYPPPLEDSVDVTAK